MARPSSYGKRLKFEVYLNLEVLRLINTDPRFKVKTMGLISVYSLRMLKKRFLSQKGTHSLQVHGSWKGKRDYKVTSKVMKDMKSIQFRSPMFNLFERGRKYKGVGAQPPWSRPYSRFARKRHVKEPGKWILTVHFKNALEGKIASYGDRAMAKAIEIMAQKAEGKGKKL